MDLDNLNFLPDWDDERFDNEDDEGEDWKNREVKLAAKALYLKWRETFSLIYAFIENLAPDAEEGIAESQQQVTKQFIYENAMIIAPKLRGAMSVDLYIIKMENAAIIRTNARQLMEQVQFAVLMEYADENYMDVIEESMNEFRLLFIDWVATFKKDEIGDDWGLFN